MVDLWLEVKDNEYYERRLQGMSLVSDLVPRPTSLLIDKMLKQYYMDMMEMFRAKGVTWPSV